MAGAAVDLNGTPTDWPGWTQLADGSWQPGDAFDWARSSLQVIAVVNPIGTAVEYPPATPGCPANPTGVDAVTENNDPGVAPQTANPALLLPQTAEPPMGQNRTVRSCFGPSSAVGPRLRCGADEHSVALVRGSTSAVTARCRWPSCGVVEGLGFDHVRTYIQSGNVVYRTGPDVEQRGSAGAEVTRISAAINDAKRFGPSCSCSALMPLPPTSPLRRSASIDGVSGVTLVFQPSQHGADRRFLQRARKPLADGLGRHRTIGPNQLHDLAFEVAQLGEAVIHGATLRSRGPNAEDRRIHGRKPQCLFPQGWPRVTGRRREIYALVLQQPALPRESAAIFDQRTVGADQAMTGQHHADRVRAIGVTDGANGPGHR